jgi:hypothetical protein
MSGRDAAGINSPYNACMFRKDAEIARLRKVLGWVAQNPEERAYWLGSVTALVAGGDVKDAEIARLRDVLTSKGFVECGIPACDCGSWHHRYGLPERWRLTPAVVACLKRGLNCWPQQNFSDGAEIREILRQAEEVKLRIGEDV